MHTMKAFVVEGPRSASVRDVPIPIPQANEVVVKVERVGICGTDFHIYKGEYIAQYPLIPGHEFSGTVAAVGEQVTGFQIGDRVTAEPNIACGQCEYCRSKRHNHCKHWQAVGVTRHGAMAEYAAVPQQCLFHLPEPLSYAAGAFIEPMACVVHGMNQLSPGIGDRALLFGAGAMGQQLIQALAHSGVSELIVVDVAPEKLTMAAKYGATTTLLSREVADFFACEPYRDGVEIVVDATGNERVIQQAFQYLGFKGTYLQFGVASQHTTIPVSPFQIYHKDWKIVGSMATNLTFQAALHWAKSNRIQLEPLVTQVISLEDLPELFASGPRSNDLKIQVQL